MSVLVRGMEMPKGCFFCPMRIKIDPDTIRCRATGNDFEETFAGTIERRNNGNCPLVEVQTPHGSLKDADALLSDDEIVQILTSNPQRTGKLIKEFAEMFVDKVNRQPTIIEAEGREE